jgi:hypothetical protein
MDSMRLEYFFYFTTAYNVLNHQILLVKLYSYRIWDSMNTWDQSYLANQIQFRDKSK